MVRRFAKEFHLLLLPGAIAAAAAALVALKGCLCPPWANGALASVMFELPPYLLLLAMGLLAAAPFGAEFQHRTLTLLVSQPCTRSRLWTEKYAALLCTGVIVAVVYALSALYKEANPGWWQWPNQRPRVALPETAVLVAGGLATICSAAFWTLLARSTIGGIVFTVCSQFLAAIGLQSLFNSFASAVAQGDVGAHQDQLGAITPPANVILAAGIVYSAFFLWLGWRQFQRLQLSYAGEGQAPDFSWSFARWRPRWLQCRPSSPTLNLLRKEIRLQKPSLMIALLFCVCWGVVSGLWLLHPDRREPYGTIRDVLAGCYMAIAPILIGCISTGEEKALGLSGWNLTLPVSAARQFLAKFAVTLGTGILLGIMLPLFMVFSNYWARPEQTTILVFVCVTVLVIGFWSGTFLANTVRAVLTSIVVLFVCTGAFFFGIRSAETTGSSYWLGTQLTKYMVVRHLPPDYLSPLVIAGAVLFFSLLFLFVAVFQSWRQFRGGESSVRRLFSKGATLALLTWACSFLAIYISLAARNHLATGSSMLNQVGTALSSLPAETGSAPNHVSIISLHDLKSTSVLAPWTERWLQDCVVTTRPAVNGQFEAIIDFPNGSSRALLFTPLLRP